MAPTPDDAGRAGKAPFGAAGTPSRRTAGDRGLAAGAPSTGSRPGKAGTGGTTTGGAGPGGAGPGHVGRGNEGRGAHPGERGERGEPREAHEDGAFSEDADSGRPAKLKLFGREFPLPGSRRGRIVLGVAMMAGGSLGFLPILGFWMIPVGLLVLSVDSPLVRRRRRRMEVRYARWRRSRRGNGDGNGDGGAGSGRTPP